MTLTFLDVSMATRQKCLYVIMRWLISDHRLFWTNKWTKSLSASRCTLETGATFVCSTSCPSAFVLQEVLVLAPKWRSKQVDGVCDIADALLTFPSDWSVFPIGVLLLVENSTEEE